MDVKLQANELPNHITTSPPPEPFETDRSFSYSTREQWIRPAILGANDGLVSTTLMIMSVGAIKPEVKVMILTGLMGLLTGACSMAIGEFVSVSSQLDVKRAQLKRQGRGEGCDEERLPNPILAAWASFLSYSGGATVPILAVAFIEPYEVRLAVVMVASTVASLVFGWLMAVIGQIPKVKSSLRGLFGSWLAMGVSFGLSKWVGSHVL